MAWYLEDDPIEILNNYALWLREDDAARDMVGDVDWLYGIGVSRATVPLLALLASPESAVLDFSFLFVPRWRRDLYAAPRLQQNHGVPDRMGSRGFRRESGCTRTPCAAVPRPTARTRWQEGRTSPIYQPIREIRLEAFGITSEGTTPLDWTPCGARAVPGRTPLDDGGNKAPAKRLPR